MRPQDLKLGSVSSSSKRASFVILILATLALRHEAVSSIVRGLPTPVEFPDLAQVFTSGSVAWTQAPLLRLLQAFDSTLGLDGRGWLAIQILFSLAVLIALLRRLPRWLGFGAAVVAAGLWSLLAHTVSGAESTGPGILLALLGISYADFLLRIAQRRASHEGWRLGLRLGLMTWVGGVGVLWLAVTLLWLPFMSHRFRGLSGVKTFAWLGLVWLLVISPILGRNALVTGDPAPPFASAPARFLDAAESDRLMPQSIAPVGANYGQRWAQWKTGVQQLGRDGGTGWRQLGRRLVAFAGGWSSPVASVGLPWAVVSVLAWLGVVALLPSARAFFPFYFGLLIPLLVATTTGLGETALLTASPFVVAMAGYGVQRWWQGRSWAATWFMAPVLLALSLLLYLWVRGWS